MRADALAAALHGRRVGRGWMARCPAHDDRRPSLAISEAEIGTPLFHCHAGCRQADVISALAALGLWRQEGIRPSTLRPARLQTPPRAAGAGHDPRSDVALRIWREAVPAIGTPVETYLRSRGITLDPPATLRLHLRLRHPSGFVGPAMIALVTTGDTDAPVAVHRTYLASDGSGKAPVEPSKMMLGPCRGAAVRLATVEDSLMVGEGIETCLAAMQATDRPAWAALSTSGLRSLELPAVVREVTILADGDDPGERAARSAALRWAQEGRRVRVARPPRGLDFNDLLMGRLPQSEGRTA